jgi:hypothetical protein
MLLSTDFASDRDLLDRVMDHGIVVEVWDRLGLAAIDMKQMHISVSTLQLFDRGKKPAFRDHYFSKVERS